MRPIDADEVLKGIEELKQSPFVNSHDSYVRHMMREALDVVAKLVIEAQPTVEAEPIRHGKWLYEREAAREMQGKATTAVFYNDWKCSECGYRISNRFTFISDVSYNYCPCCGAKMEGEGEE